jgi:zinc protease
MPVLRIPKNHSKALQPLHELVAERDLSSSSPHDEGVGRGLRRGAVPTKTSLLSPPLSSLREKREKTKSSLLGSWTHAVSKCRRVGTLWVGRAAAAWLLAYTFSSVAQTAQPARSYKDLKYPPLNRIQVAEPTRLELANGMVVFLVEDHELPMISLGALIRAGSRWEPIEKAGVAAIAGSVMRTGGTPSRNGDKLDEELDRLGAVVETWISEDSGGATMSVLKEDSDSGLDILADVLQHPAFPEEKIELEKIAQRDAIARRNDNPTGIFFREFRRVLFGKDSPYGHQTEYDTIKAIKRDDLVAFHRQFFQPENVILGVWGDFKAASMRARIEKTFGDWKRGGRPKPAAPEVDPGAWQRAGLYSINKQDVNQSLVVMGHLGGKRNDPDYYALTIMDSILGGSFASRLFSQVRSVQGLAYSVFSDWSAGWDRLGSFHAGGGTKSETTLKIIGAIKHEVVKLAEADVTDEELARAKDSILKGFAFEFDSTAKIVQRLMRYEYFGYPRDYLQRYQENIGKVTKADVLRVAKQYLKPDQFIILVLGKEKDFEQPLSSLGKVTPIDISIPTPKAEPLAAATPEAASQGKEILGKALDAMGGPAIGAVKEFIVIADLVLRAPQGEFSMKTESTVRLAGKLLTKMTTPVGEILQGFDGKTAWMKTPQGTQDLPDSQREEMESNIFRNTFSLFQNFESNAVKVQALGSATVDGQAVDSVAIIDPAHNRQVQLLIDSKTHLPLKKIYTASLMGAPGEVEEVYSDYREISGLKIPFKVILNQNGKKLGEQTTTEVKINPGLKDEAFNKP